MKTCKSTQLIFLFLMIIAMLIMRIQAEEISIIDKNGEITFSKIIDISIPLTEYTSIERDKYVIGHSILSIQLNATSDVNCDKKGNCGQPIRLYGKLNSEPHPEEFLFDKKDDNGKFYNGHFIYGFEYSPCHFEMDDTLNIKMVGVEGKSQYKLSIKFIYLNDYEIICPNLKQPDMKIPLMIYPGVTTSRIGTVYYGGRNSVTNVISDSLYFLDNDLKWKEILRVSSSSIDQSSNDKLLGESSDETNSGALPSKPWPSARIGPLMIEIDNDYIIMFGGKDSLSNCLSDLWAFNLNDLTWIEIDYNGSLKVPKCKYLPSGLLLPNKGSIIIFGGKQETIDKNINFIDVKILKELIEYNLNPSKYKKKYDDVIYEELIGHLYQIIEIPNITPRYGLTITQIDNEEILFFGGFDDNDLPLSTGEILNLKTMKLDTLNNNGYETPLSRGFHSMTKYGSIVFLYGGKGQNENFKDMWKFLIPIKKWIKISSSILEQYSRFFFLQKSNFVISNIHSKLDNSERPIIIGGDTVTNELNTDIIKLKLPICESDTQIYSSGLCLPCSEGYEYSKGECEKCYPGKYLKYDIGAYSKSTCTTCPPGTYNDLYAQKSINNCKACPYETFNDLPGQIKCKECPDDFICLPGSTLSITPHKPLIHSNIEKKTYLSAANYPEFIDQNSKMKLLSLTSGIIIVIVLTTLVCIIIGICLKVTRNKTNAFLICVDFLPLTGGNEKKSNGGFITIIYSILICSLAISFILRYCLWNDIVEITTIDSSKEQKKLSESFEMTIEVIGNELPCIARESQQTENGKWKTCHSDIHFSKNNNANYFIDKQKMFSCAQHNNNNQCLIKFTCEDCKHIDNKDTISIHFKSFNTYVQLFNWEFASYWSEIVQDEEKGYSIIKGLLKPYQNIQYNYVFKGEKASTIALLLTPIYYSMKSEMLELAGYRASLSSYERGDVKNEYSFTNEEQGVALDLKFSISQSTHQVNVKKDISLLDFFAFLLGMLAGFSFLSRITKYALEKCNCLNYTQENYLPFKDEKEDKKAEFTTQNP